MSRIQDLLDELVEAIRAELRAEFMVKLTDGGIMSEQPKRGRGGRPKAAPKARAKGAKRTAEELEKLTADVAAFIKKTPGSSVEAIGAGLGVPTKDLALPIKKLQAEKRLRTTGQRRGTKYSLK